MLFGVISGFLKDYNCVCIGVISRFLKDYNCVCICGHCAVLTCSLCHIVFVSKWIFPVERLYWWNDTQCICLFAVLYS